MAKEIIQIGNKIEMRAVSNHTLTLENPIPEIYVSQFMQWTEENVAVIAVPSFKGHLVPLRLDEVYVLQFFTKNGLYQCKGKIVKRDKNSGHIATAEVKFISDLEKIQRRQYYRMNCIMPMTYSVLTDEQKELYKEKRYCLLPEERMIIEQKLEKEEITFLKGMVLDISGGGMRFNSTVQLECDDVLLLQPALPEALRKKIPFLFGRVITSIRIPNKEPIAFDNRIEFIEINSSEREQIITYIFKEERDKRKRDNDLK